jgi:hypothetical protein
VYTTANIPEIMRRGVTYRKTATITAVLAPAGTAVKTTEGVTTLDEAGFVATDGESVWPISERFMRANYRPEHTDDVP